jgi:hypothetical protein
MFWLSRLRGILFSDPEREKELKDEDWNKY